MNANWSGWARPARLGLMLGVSLAMTGCATNGAVIDSGACTAWQPISSSSADTEQTRREVIANNAAWKAYCDGE